MSNFFSIADLFVGRDFELPRRTYLEHKVVHFTYFSALWVLARLST